jgi:hypothetical protein
MDFSCEKFHIYFVKNSQNGACQQFPAKVLLMAYIQLLMYKTHGIVRLYANDPTDFVLLAWAAESEVIPMRVMGVAMLMGRVVTGERRAEREKGGSSQAAIFHRTPSLCICYVICTLSGGIAMTMPTVSKA